MNAYSCPLESMSTRPEICLKDPFYRRYVDAVATLQRKLLTLVQLLRPFAFVASRMSQGVGIWNKLDNPDIVNWPEMTTQVLACALQLQTVPLVYCPVEGSLCPFAGGGNNYDQPWYQSAMHLNAVYDAAERNLPVYVKQTPQLWEAWFAVVLEFQKWQRCVFHLSIDRIHAEARRYKRGLRSVPRSDLRPPTCKESEFLEGHSELSAAEALQSCNSARRSSFTRVERLLSLLSFTTPTGISTNGDSSAVVSRNSSSRWSDKQV